MQQPTGDEHHINPGENTSMRDPTRRYDFGQRSDTPI